MPNNKLNTATPIACDVLANPGNCSTYVLFNSSTKCVHCTVKYHSKCGDIGGPCFLLKEDVTTGGTAVFVYYDSKNECFQVCFTGCTSCVGDGFDKCLFCNATSGYLEFNRTDDKNTISCLLACPPGFKENRISTPYCYKCHILCKECYGKNKDDCTKCSSFAFTIYPIAVTHACDYDCAKNMYLLSDFLCELCDPLCGACKGKTNKNCTECTINSYQLIDVRVTSTCLDKCIDGTFLNTATRICEVCHASCATCLDSTNSNCLTCSSGFFLQLNTKGLYSCLITCPIQTYKDLALLQCMPCGGDCFECFGGSENQCISCSNGYFLYNNTCDVTCPVGTYQNYMNNICDRCYSKCTICIQYAVCSACLSPNMYYRQSCYSTCPQKSYPINKIECADCHMSCTNCNGNTERNCTRCDTKNGYFNEEHGSYFLCLYVCSSGFYKNKATKKCTPCKINCATCQDSDSNCITCNIPLGYAFTPQNQCAQFSCDDSSYRNKTTNQCIKCDPHCGTCVSNTKFNCIKCFSASGFIPVMNANGTLTCNTCSETDARLSSRRK